MHERDAGAGDEASTTGPSGFVVAVPPPMSGSMSGQACETTAVLHWDLPGGLGTVHGNAAALASMLLTVLEAGPR